MPARLSKRLELLSATHGNNKTQTRRTSIRKRNDGTEEILDENDDPIDSRYATTTRFKAYNAIVRPDVSRYRDSGALTALTMTTFRDEFTS